MLHLTKVAAGCTDIETLAARQAHWWGAGRAGAHTRFMPKRAEELIGVDQTGRGATFLRRLPVRWPCCWGWCAL